MSRSGRWWRRPHACLRLCVGIDLSPGTGSAPLRHSRKWLLRIRGLLRAESMRCLLHGPEQALFDVSSDGFRWSCECLSGNIYDSSWCLALCCYVASCEQPAVLQAAAGGRRQIRRIGTEEGVAPGLSSDACSSAVETEGQRHGETGAGTDWPATRRPRACPRMSEGAKCSYK